MKVHKIDDVEWTWQGKGGQEEPLAQWKGLRPVIFTGMPIMSGTYA